ncbi:hypothetical protein C8J57DRAFT_1220942 [Mycena rebaudengoi]|nr:hypothetical protein C8J57DRAFT_1220942 [Mycena rebaudengoi]
MHARLFHRLDEDKVARLRSLQTCQVKSRFSPRCAGPRLKHPMLSRQNPAESLAAWSLDQVYAQACMDSLIVRVFKATNSKFSGGAAFGSTRTQRYLCIRPKILSLRRSGTRSLVCWLTQVVLGVRGHKYGRVLKGADLRVILAACSFHVLHKF